MTKFLNSPEEDDDENYQRIFLTERRKRSKEPKKGNNTERATYKSGNLDDLKRAENNDWTRVKRYSNHNEDMRLPMKSRERQNSIVTKRRIRLDLLCKQLDEELNGNLD